MSSVSNRRGFLKASIIAAGLAAAPYYGMDYGRIAMVSSKSKVFSSSNTTPVPSNLEIPHLLRRAGFVGGPQEIASYTNLGFSGAVNQLFNYQNINNSQLAARPNIKMALITNDFQQDYQALQAWVARSDDPHKPSA